MKKGRLPREVASVPEVRAFFPLLSSALSHLLPQLGDRTVSIPTHSQTKHHYFKEYVVMESEANTTAASMAKQRKSSPHTPVRQRWVESSLHHLGRSGNSALSEGAS